MKNYNVTFEIHDPEEGLKIKSKTFEANDPGGAFYKCAKANPGCRLIRASVQRRIWGAQLWQDFEPPPNPRLKFPLMPIEKRVQIEMDL